MRPEKLVHFAASLEAIRQLEVASDFFGGAAVALENLRWQMRGFIDAYPEMPQEEVVARFAGGSPTGGGTNALTLTVMRSQEEELRLLTGLRLINAISIYEAWCESLIEEVEKSSSVKAKRLQYPASVDGALKALEGQPTPLMTEVKRGYEERPLHFPKALRELLLCYRAFKEARNCLAHGGGLADRKARTAWEEYERCDRAWFEKKLMRARPGLSEVIEGQPIDLSWRGVIGFSGALHRLIVTCDGRITGGAAALERSIARWQSSDVPDANLIRAYAGNNSKFGYRWARLGLPQLGSSSQPMLEEFLRRGLVELR